MSLLDAVETILTGEGWRFIRLPDGAGLSTTLNTADATWPFVAMADDEENVILFYSVLPGRVPQDRRSIVEEFLTRTNYGLLVGAFELDLDDGEVRLRTSADVGGQQVSPELLHALVGRNVAMAERHFPKIHALIQHPETG